VTGTSAPRVGVTIAESTPTYPQVARTRPGAPNVVVIVLDDLGFAQLGAFGSTIATPAIDRIASDGARYRRFHVTSLCSPTRASFISGRNHHAVGMGFLSDVPMAFPGYDGRIPPTAATLPRILRDAGYSTFAVGKWHLTPRWELSASGPFDRWPLGLGFERFYGFLGGDTNQWTPALVSDNGAVEPPRTPQEGYHLTEDLADRAIRLVHDQQQATPDKPFFLYFATGATHAPHQAPAAWIDRYRGAFDGGWERWREEVFARQLAAGVVPSDTTLTPRPPWVDAWDDLPDERRRVAARFMEAFAGFLSHTDAQIGRVLDHLEALEVLDDTIVMLFSDNGASAEGGPDGLLNEHRFISNDVDDHAEQAKLAAEIGGFRVYNHYPWGWAWAGNTPFHLWKRYAWLGGVRTPLIVRWPGHVVEASVVRDQFVHVTDLLPTILESVGVEAPTTVDGITQQPIDGASIAESFHDPSAPGARTTQYFEMLGSRAIYHDGWKATTDHVSPALDVESVIPGSRTFSEDTWALFDLRNDFAEAHDLSASEPARLQSLVDLWWAEAGRNQVLPMDDGFLSRLPALVPSPWGPRWQVTLTPGGSPVAEEALPPLFLGFRVEAAVTVPEEGAHGVLAALGDWSGGWALLLEAGRPVFTLNLHGSPTRIVGEQGVPPGEHVVGISFEPSAPGGTFVLDVDGTDVARSTIARDLPVRWQVGGAGLSIGRDVGFPVDDSYEPPFPFTGTLSEVRVEVAALAPADPADEIALALQHE
jgi:arylsulfatase